MGVGVCPRTDRLLPVVTEGCSLCLSLQVVQRDGPRSRSVQSWGPVGPLQLQEAKGLGWAQAPVGVVWPGSLLKALSGTRPPSQVPQPQGAAQIRARQRETRWG